MSALHTEAPLMGEVTVEINGRKFQIPEGITAIDAMWYTGHPIVHGVGCLGGVCGACAIFYTTPESPAFRVALGCRTLVEEGMSFFFAPRSPQTHYPYELARVEAPAGELLAHFPKSADCRHCHGCTNACPQGIPVEECVELARQGDFKTVAQKALSCIMCGLCHHTCPAEMEPNHILLYARRTYAAQLGQRPEELTRRIQEIGTGAYRAEWDRILGLDETALAALAEQSAAGG